jgi:hypothetical protein
MQMPFEPRAGTGWMSFLESNETDLTVGKGKERRRKLNPLVQQSMEKKGGGSFSFSFSFLFSSFPGK